MKPIFFKSPGEFRVWLDTKPRTCAELWVGFYRKSSGRPTITYPEAVDEALCFGWIDGVRKSVAGDAYMVRFTPRKPKSQWSTVNLKRAKALSDAGRMRAAGLDAFAGAKGQRPKYSYEQRHGASFSQEQERRFRAHAAAWNFFQNQPPWYRRTATFWVVSAKKEETRQRRLETLIADSGRGSPVGPLKRPVPNRHEKRR